MYKPYDQFLVELHEHLGGSSSPAFLWELAHEQGIRLSEKDYWNFIRSVTINQKTTQKKYHALYDLIQTIQSSPYAVERSVHYAVSSAYRRAGVNLIELRFNPMRRNRGGEHDLDKIILAATVGLKKACLEYPVKAGLIIELDRRFSKEQNAILTAKAIAFRGDGIVGIDVSGPHHPGFRIDDMIPLYDQARNAGLGLTFHTGEFTPAAEIWEVVKKLRPQRLGHGIRCVDDEDLMTYLHEAGTVLEVCPTSNIRTRVVSDWQEVKAIISRLMDRGVRFTVCSDSPEFFSVTVRSEMARLVHLEALNPSQARQISDTAVRAAFIK